MRAGAVRSTGSPAAASGCSCAGPTSPRSDQLSSALRREPDGGAGSVLVVALGMVVVVGSLLVGSVVQAVVVRHQAATAADLGALAAADLLARGDLGACDAAADVVAASGARLVVCRPGADGSVVVGVSRGLGGVLSGLGPAQVSARAGPPGPHPGQGEGIDSGGGQGEGAGRG